MEKYLTHPYASPLFGDFKGLPPLLIQVGDAEVLRDEVTLLAHKATLQGVEVRHELYEDAVCVISLISLFGVITMAQLKIPIYQIHVFQAYPFLEASGRSFLSCRDFVRNILPQFQSRSPQPLGGAAEAVLEDEIDNEKACVVSGDGQETATGMQDVKAELGNEEDAKTESDSGDDVANQKTYPSWRNSQIWSPSLSGDDDTDDSGSEPETAPPAYSAVTPHSVLRRIKSAISVLIPDSAPTHTPAPSAVLPPTRTRHHRRTPSHQSAHQEPVRPRHRYSISNLAPSTSPPPSPSIRRSNVSHPNVTSLIQQWATSGPANQTLTYKPS
jgi:hypothetical protein